MLRLRMISGGAGLDLGALGLDCPRGILVVQGGGGMCVVGGERVRFASGDVFFLGAGPGFRVVEGELAAGHLLCLELAYLEWFLLQYPLGRSLGLFAQLTWVPLSRGRLLGVLERVRLLSLELERGAGFDFLKMAFSLFLLEVVGDRLVLALPFDEGRRLMGLFKGLLEEHFRLERKSGFYAERMCISRRKLNVLCRVWYGGKRFDEVARDRLLSEAEFMLLGSDEAIKAVAFGLGFCSLQHFRGWFKACRGVSPSVFRASGGKVDGVTDLDIPV